MLGERVKKLTKLMLTGLTMALCVADIFTDSKDRSSDVAGE